ncbi:MAG: hypothetical protein JJU25_18570 [Halomonas sp.]|nr:hypothetical protein [Halomonas sp.]MCC5884627.1 hypothetical protein [Halomonas sp.]
MPERDNRAASSENEIVIVFEGEPNTRFQATLTVHDGNQAITHELEESVPSEYRFQAEALEAHIRQTSREGALSVEVRKHGSVSRSSTHGENSEIRLRIR